MEELIKRLEHIEDEMDKIDGDYGTKESYCYWCGSTKTNGQVGIVHVPTCPKQIVRDRIKNEKTSTKK